MHIHEYQAKEILKEYNILIPDGGVAFSAEEAVSVAESINSNNGWIVKAQIHAGGRSKGYFIGDEKGVGGIRFADSIEEVRKHANDMLGSVLVTAQTGRSGQKVKKVYVESAFNVTSEIYLAMTVDRSTGYVMVIASAKGGVDIEEISSKDITKELVDPVISIKPYQARRIAFALGLPNNMISKMASVIMATYNAFMHYDALLIEYNPLIISTDGSVMALDAKMQFDDNALFRHRRIRDLRDEDEENAKELEAQEHNLSYIKLTGDIGCMVNGAGLAMATMDIIHHYGGEPANFLDVGGGAGADRISTAFKFLVGDEKVKAILVNIFGGIARCDLIAEGIVNAARETEVRVPLIVRLEGTNEEKGREILIASGLSIIYAKNLSDAAEKVVSAAKVGGV